MELERRKLFNTDLNCLVLLDKFLICQNREVNPLSKDLTSARLLDILDYQTLPILT